MTSLPPASPHDPESSDSLGASLREASPFPESKERSTDRPKERVLSWKRFLIETMIVFGLAIPLALGLHTFVTQVYAISGSSMEPTLHHGERVVIDKLGPAFTDLGPGDMVIFSSPNDPAKNLVKRVIGVAGDRITFRGDRVYRNGGEVTETYALSGLYHQNRSFDVAEGQIFVLGDNRPQSKDSRHFGPVEVESVRGRVLFRLWPLDSITSF